MNFDAILDAPINAEVFEKPKPLPEGSYIFQIEPKYEQAPNRNNNLQIVYQARVIEALEDVDPDELALVKNLQTRKVRVSFFLTEAAAFRFAEFVEVCGLEKGITAREAIEQLQNAQFVGKVEHSPNEKDPESPFANIVSYAALP